MYSKILYTISHPKTCKILFTSFDIDEVKAYLNRLPISLARKCPCCSTQLYFSENTTMEVYDVPKKNAR